MASRTAADRTRDEFYTAFVKSLFENASTLLMGVLSQASIIALVYGRTGHPVYGVLLTALIGIGLIRFTVIRYYANHSATLTVELARKRELIYVISGALHGACLGAFTLISIYLVQDEFAEIASISVALATAISIPGRNYGSAWSVMVLLASVVLPISVGLILRGDIFHFVLGVFTLPIFLATRVFAMSVRGVLLKALTEQRKSTSLALRFDKALNTMTHGLVMIDANERVVVINQQALGLFSARSVDQMIGRSFSALLGRGVAAGLLDRRDARFISQQLSRAIREGRNRKVLIKLNDDRYFELSAREGDDELSVITFEDVSARIASQEKIRYMARFDSLTGLANRGHFQELVNEALANNNPERNCAVLVLDLDDFKSVNDTLGHPVGDGLIFAIAERLSDYVDDQARLSRFGGDEFMVYFDDIADEADLRARIARIFKGLSAPADVAGNMMPLQVSGGAAMCKVADAVVDTLIVKADLALYKAKDMGKNSWQLFEDSMDRAFRERQKLKAELRGAVERDELTVLYQPIIEARTLRVTSCEALCRWHHHELGNVPPSVFIPLAEEMGIISQISAFVLKRAARDCAEMSNELKVSVNLSANDFRSPEIVQLVERSLRLANLPAERFEVEVTETALVDDKAKTWAYLQDIKKLGVSIALDDFGTGYSNLGYLNALPLDKLKVDRSFLSDVETNPRSLELLKGVVELSRRLRLKVTIEGVETENQFRLLVREVDPDLIQGFLFGAPLSKMGLMAMVQALQPLAKVHRSDIAAKV